MTTLILGVSLAHGKELIATCKEEPGVNTSSAQWKDLAFIVKEGEGDVSVGKSLILTYSFNKYLLNPYHIPHFVISIKVTGVNETLSS